MQRCGCIDTWEVKRRGASDLLRIIRSLVGMTYTREMELASAMSALLSVFPVEHSTAGVSSEKQGNRRGHGDEPVLIKLGCGDNNIALVNSDGGSGTIRLILLHAVDIDDPLLALDLSDLPFTALVLPSYDAHFVIFSYR